ncbi:UNVERIFIED_CONTAM: hypothetical protein Slati_3860100 [Sesamum latifolium]|uniref:Uncharacterized protein n=1 Tax=Sesamum latifolium TaxID=2727402 RepID=A0AAW2TLG8_9LAMI
MKSIGWTWQLAGHVLSSPRGSEVASHELAGCELTRSQATSSQDASSLARQVASSQVADSWRRVITDLGRKV